MRLSQSLRTTDSHRIVPVFFVAEDLYTEFVRIIAHEPMMSGPVGHKSSLFE
jgi:hypothetical protein